MTQLVVPDDVTRCRPSQPCQLRFQCMRWNTSIAQKYSSMADFSIVSGDGECKHFLGAEDVRKMAARPPADPHEFVPGMI